MSIDLLQTDRHFRRGGREDWRRADQRDKRPLYEKSEETL